jgi:hypothetical protein
MSDLFNAWLRPVQFLPRLSLLLWRCLFIAEAHSGGQMRKIRLHNLSISELLQQPYLH